MAKNLKANGLLFVCVPVKVRTQTNRNGCCSKAAALFRPFPNAPRIIPSSAVAPSNKSPPPAIENGKAIVQPIPENPFHAPVEPSRPRPRSRPPLGGDPQFVKAEGSLNRRRCPLTFLPSKSISTGCPKRSPPSSNR